MSLGTKTVELSCRDTEGPVVGVCNGTNAAFTLAYRPTTNVALFVALNGLLQRENADYTLFGNVVTFTHAPLTGDRIDFCYPSQFSV